MRRTGMTKLILILFSAMTIGSLYNTYEGIGLQEVVSKEPQTKTHHSVRTGHYNSGGWGYGK